MAALSFSASDLASAFDIEVVIPEGAEYRARRIVAARSAIDANYDAYSFRACFESDRHALPIIKPGGSWLRRAEYGSVCCIHNFDYRGAGALQLAGLNKACEIVLSSRLYNYQLRKGDIEIRARLEYQPQ